MYLLPHEQRPSVKRCPSKARSTEETEERKEKNKRKKERKKERDRERKNERKKSEKEELSHWYSSGGKGPLMKDQAALKRKNIYSLIVRCQNRSS